MGLRIGRRLSLGSGKSINVSKSSVSASKRGRHGSVGMGRRGPRGSVRLMKGVSWTWGKR